MGKLFEGEREDEGKNLNVAKKSKSLTPMLDFFGRDLTKLAAESKLDQVFGREKEIEQIVQILNKRKKNNPLLVGEPGVGKCFCEDSMVTIKNDLTGDVLEITVKEFLRALSYS